MAKIEQLVEEFLGQSRIAVVGVSDRRETGCNEAYHRFVQAGYTVYPVNPRLTTFEGSPCYPDLASIPHAPQAVFIMTNPQITDSIVEQCIQIGVEHVWMHCMMGTKPGLAAQMTSVSQPAVDACRQHGIKVIPGSCPNQFLNPDGGHRVMRALWGALGFMRVSTNGSAS